MTEKTTKENRLASEPSLYLRQHGHNPVDWYPWGEEALKVARAGDMPILLSIGYSSCHWCHVMAHESFEDPETARVMNEHFVNIKVDREERPDLDDVYMTAVQALAGHGGWPMTVFLTPDGRPFYGGTYFPPDERHGLPGFKDLLHFLAEQYRTNRAEIERIAGEVERAVAAGSRADGLHGPVGPSLLDGALAQVMDAYEPRYGGFSVRPKFPQPATVMLLQRLGQDDSDAREALTHTLDGMIAGGMYDLVGGGFHRYSVDEKWLVPHFEKMLYDNALLVLTYLDAFRLTGDARYERVVVETLDYLLREMRLEGGGFAAALDADTPEGEGRFYAWTRDELRESVGLEDAGWAYDYFGFTPRGNYHGMTLPRQSMSLDDLARELHITPDVALTRLDGAREKMRLARERNHMRPARDDKLLVDWNGLTISAFARAGRQLGNEAYMGAARQAADFILGKMRDDAGRLMHVHAGGRAYGDAFLDDYAALMGGLLDLHDMDGDGRWTEAAEALTGRVVAHFWDPKSGGFFFTSDDHEQLLARPMNYSDLPLPSGNALMVRNLTRLATVLDRPAWRDTARQTLERFGHGMTHSAQGFSYMLIALQEYLEGEKPAY
jgi:uncharacterized protein